MKTQFLSKSRAVVGAGAAALALLATGCTDRTEPAPDRGLDYYPVAVGNYWIYAVTDSSFSQATDANPRSTVQVSSFQFREAVTETFPDATKQPVYRLVRSRRNSTADAWKADSVFVLNPDSHGVVLTRNNLKTLELIFPVRDGHLWNFNAYNNNSNDTIVAETRRYRNIGQPRTTTVGTSVQTYPNTVTTTDEGTAKFEDSYYVKTYEQVFAKGVGPVQRRRRRFSNFYTLSSGGNVNFVPRTYFFGFSRTETLVDYGPR